MRRLSVIILTLSFILSLAACSSTQNTGGSQIAGNAGTVEPANTQTAGNAGTAEPANTARSTGETEPTGTQASENAGSAEPTDTADSAVTPQPSGKKLPKADAVLKGKIILLNDKSFLFAGTGASDLYTVSGAPAIYDIDNKATDSSALKPGQNIEVGYSGAIMESYPAQLGKPVYVRIVGQGDDMVGFYKTVLNDLWNVDKGLNSDISIIAFDLSKVTNLNDAEKSALVYAVSTSYGLQGISGTIDELREQGYIDKGKLYFETGILFKLEITDAADNGFTFKAEKWRSGDGAYYFIDCKAAKSDSGWSYTVGQQAIS